MGPEEQDTSEEGLLTLKEGVENNLSEKKAGARLASRQKAKSSTWLQLASFEHLPVE